jgi:hypothetical protein
MTDISIESLSNPHRDLPDDTQMHAQLIIDEIILSQTVALKKDTVHQSWKLKIDFEM